MSFEETLIGAEIRDLFSEADRVSNSGCKVETTFAYDCSRNPENQLFAAHISQVVADPQYELARSQDGESVVVPSSNGHGLVSHLEIDDAE